MSKLLLATLVVAAALRAGAQSYSWRFYSVSGSGASGQISSTDPTYPFDVRLPTPPVATSSSFFINDLGLSLDLTTALNSALQPPVEPLLVPAYAPDGGSSLMLGPFHGYAPPLVLDGISFTINPNENFPQAPDPQQWQYGALSGTGYWELMSVPEPSTVALLTAWLPWLWLARQKSLGASGHARDPRRPPAVDDCTRHLAVSWCSSESLTLTNPLIPVSSRNLGPGC